MPETNLIITDPTLAATIVAISYSTIIGFARRWILMVNNKIEKNSNQIESLKVQLTDITKETNKHLEDSIHSLLENIRSDISLLSKEISLSVDNIQKDNERKLISFETLISKRIEGNRKNFISRDELSRFISNVNFKLESMLNHFEKRPARQLTKLNRTKV